MSPWSRERIEVRLSPQAVMLRRLAGRRELNRYRLEVDETDGARDWKPGLDVFQAKISSLSWRRADLHVVLSGHFTRFVVMPWSDNISEKDAGEYAMHQFRSIYGSSAEAWEVCLGRTHSRRPRVAAAVERALVDTLKTQATAAGLHLCSLRPWLSAVVDALPAKDRVLSGWVALVEPGGMHVACLDGGHCIDVRSALVVGDAVPQLLSLLQQSALGLDRETDNALVKVYAADETDCTLLREHGWQVVMAAAENS